MVDANFVAKINLIPAGHNTMAVACVDRINLSPKRYPRVQLLWDN